MHSGDEYLTMAGNGDGGEAVEYLAPIDGTAQGIIFRDAV